MRNSQISPPRNIRRDHFLISTDSENIDIKMVHHFLDNEAYWIQGITRQAVERLLEHALCFGVYDCSDEGEIQIGFARVITDYASFGYLSDVFILTKYRGQGLGKWLISCILAHPDLQELRKWMLNTADAHTLYERFGFRLNTEQDSYMSYRPQKGQTSPAP